MKRAVLLAALLGAVALADDAKFRVTKAWSDPPPQHGARSIVVPSDDAGYALLVAHGLRRFDVAARTFARVTPDLDVVAASPDGEWIACVTTQGSVRTYDIRGARPRDLALVREGPIHVVFFRSAPKVAVGVGREVTVRTRDSDVPYFIELSRDPIGIWELDGSHLVIKTDDHELHIHDLLTGHSTKIPPPFHAQVESLATIPATKRLVVSARGNLRIYDLSAGIAEPLAVVPSATLVGPIAASADGTRVLVGDDRGDIHVYDQSWNERLVLEGHFARVSAIGVSPGGKLAVSSARDGTLRAWDLATGRELTDVPCHRGAITAIAISDDGSTVVTGSADRTVRLWDERTGANFLTLRGERRDIEAVAFSPREMDVAASDGEKVRTWEVATGRTKRVLEGQNVRALQFDMAGELIAHAERAGAIAILGSGGAVHATSSAVVILDARGTAVKTIPHGWQPRSLSVSADGKLALLLDPGFEVWDLERGELLQQLENFDDSHGPCALSPDGSRALTGHEKGVALWNLGGGFVEEVIPLDDRATALAWLSESSVLVGTNRGRLIRLDRR